MLSSSNLAEPQGSGLPPRGCCSDVVGGLEGCFKDAVRPTVVMMFHVSDTGGLPLEKTGIKIHVSTAIFHAMLFSFLLQHFKLDAKPPSGMLALKRF